jgi:hypothetical protein
MSTRNFSWEYRWPVREADKLYQLHVPNVMKMWEPKPPGTLWATPGLLRDSFTLFTKEKTGTYRLLQ